MERRAYTKDWAEGIEDLVGAHMAVCVYDTLAGGLHPAEQRRSSAVMANGQGKECAVSPPNKCVGLWGEIFDRSTTAGQIWLAHPRAAPHWLKPRVGLGQRTHLIEAPPKQARQLINTNVPAEYIADLTFL